METPLPEPRRKGRGAVGNPAGRYEPTQRHAVDDGWWREDDLPPLATTVTDERARTALAWNDSPDIGFDRSINPYRGCEHGCIYCYARPSHAYAGLSPGLDFETTLFVKVNAAEALEKELRKPGYKPATVLLGANTDPYQPVERTRRITRAVLEVLAAFRHPVGIVTKSALICRDLDLLAPLAADRLAAVGVSVTTLNPHLARVMEPRAASPKRRLATIRALSEAGVPVTVMAAPMIPFVNDHELEDILAAARAHGATEAAMILVRLPLEVKALFSGWLTANFPARAGRVLERIRDSRDGDLYNAEFGTRMTGTGPYAEMLQSRFRLACRRLGLAEGGEARRGLDTTRFEVPLARGGQLSLF